MNISNTSFVTYFNKFYLLKGLTMISSLIHYLPGAQVWVLVFDVYSEKILKKINFPGVHIITLKEFEDSKLKKAKKNRSSIEYFWTCTPSLPLFVLKKNTSLNKIVYLDADLFFYSSPKSAIEEMGLNDILTVEHRYPRSQKGRENTSGRFNVGFQVFKKSSQGIKCLNRWRNQCLDWCYARYEDGKMGDQLYLNEWPELYNKLFISNNLGLNAAPWNIERYKVKSQKGNVYVNSDKLICYHFHQFEILGPKKFDHTSGYRLSPATRKYIYKPYTKVIREHYNLVKKIDPNFEIKIKKRNLSKKINTHLLNIWTPFFGGKSRRRGLRKKLLSGKSNY